MEEPQHMSLQLGVTNIDVPEYVHGFKFTGVELETLRASDGAE
jgi:hypothetical protein